MLELKTLEDVRGNTTVIYSIKTLITRKTFPNLSIFAGVMGVGKTSVAKIVARMVDETETPTTVYNCGTISDVSRLQEEVFSLNPIKPKVFIFEELHALNRASQEALLQMFDSQAKNIYIICTTTELYKVRRTIKSRSHVWEFKSLSEKQLAQLLDDYLNDKGVTLSVESKNALLRSSKGIPRDLLHNTDFAVDGDFTATQLDELLGNISDELMYSIFSTLKSKPSDFVGGINTLMSDTGVERFAALRDFWLRYLLERSSGNLTTLSNEVVKGLNGVFADDEVTAVTKALISANHETILLVLLQLNMQLSRESDSAVLGYQIDGAQTASVERRLENVSVKTVRPSVGVTAKAVKNMKF